MLDGTARSAGRLASAVRSGVRTLTPVDSNPVPADWDHVTKVDPERDKRLPLAYPLYLRHTDAISVGGSRDVTTESTAATFELLRYVPTPVFQEPSAPTHITDRIREQAEFLAIPEVLNGDVEALVGDLGAGIDHVRNETAPRMLDEKFPWLPNRVRAALSEFVASWFLAAANFEGYVIQNPDSDAAATAGVDPGDVLGPEEAARRCLAAERHLGSEVLYVEYSGVYGGQEGSDVVAAVDDATSWSRVWYGGGIDSRDRAVRMLEAGADAVVVGDAFHEVAVEEAELAGKALRELSPGEDLLAVEEFVADQLDVADSRAASFLSTIPAVDNPEATALDHLATGVWLRLAVEDLVEDARRADTTDDLREFLRSEGVPGEAEMADMGRKGKAYAQAAVLSVLAARVDVEADVLPVDHLGIADRLAPTEQEL